MIFTEGPRLLALSRLGSGWPGPAPSPDLAVVWLNAIDMMFFIPAYPFWALTIIAVDVVALYGLCAYGSRENLDAV